MAGRYTGSYLDRSNGWRAVAILAEIGRASLIECVPLITYNLSGVATITPAREPEDGFSTSAIGR